KNDSSCQFQNDRSGYHFSLRMFQPGIRGSSESVMSIDFPCHELRQTVKLAAKADRGERVMVADELIGQIGAEAERSAQGEELQGTAQTASRTGTTGNGLERNAAGNVEEQRCLGRSSGVIGIGAADGNE